MRSLSLATEIPRADRPLARQLSRDPAVGDPEVGRLSALEVERAWGRADTFDAAALASLRRLSERLGVPVPRRFAEGQTPVFAPSAADPRTGEPRRRTTIINTIGPACADVDTLTAMISAGMDVARINFSHVRTFEEAKARVEALEAAMQKAGRRIQVLADLQGPKIRTGPINQPFTITTGTRVTLTPAGRDGAVAPGSVPLDPPSLLKDLKVGDRVFIDDGKLALRVARAERGHVEADVLVGGEVKSRKGLNFPDSALSARVPTVEDELSIDIIKRLTLGGRPAFDLVAVSFVEHGDDLVRVREALGYPVKLVAKIERPVALRDENLRSIYAATDAVMVARGDLAVELGFAEVPLVTRKLLSLGRQLGVPTGVATEMLESMTELRPPTRAEVNDVAGTVLHLGAFVMTSGETASGKQPVEVVRTMAAIVETTERAQRMGVRSQAAGA